MTENKELFEEMAAYLMKEGYIEKPKEGTEEYDAAKETAILQKAGLLPKK